MSLAVFATSTVSAGDSCSPIDHSDELENRFGRSDLARTDAQLRDLFENPTVIESSATHPVDERASVQTLIETHAVFPVAAGDLMATLTANDYLTEFMPSLSEHEIVCFPSEHVSRQRQRTDFGLLIFTLGTEYVIDVEYVLRGPDRYATHWALVESLDGRMGYIYGSWYFESVLLDGQPVTYVRHYARTGLTTRMPGVRGFIARRMEGEIRTLFDAIYDEAVERYGRLARR